MQRLEKSNIDNMIEANKIKEQKKEIPGKDDMNNLINIDDFLKVDLRVAKIINADYIEGADSLLQIKLDVGNLGEKTVFAGIKSNYNPDVLVGKNTVFVANLQPRKMKFGLSEGMILAASDQEYGPFILYPDDGAKPGMKIK
jgi:methionyl-tRNA synthetase